MLIHVVLLAGGLTPFLLQIPVTALHYVPILFVGPLWLGSSAAMWTAPSAHS